MKRKHYQAACGIFMSLFFLTAQAQTLKQTIRGRVTDTDSGMPLVGVTLYIAGSNPIVGTITDPDGYFAFKELPIGRYNVAIDYIGYEGMIVPNVLIGAGKEAVLNVNLTESVTNLDEVVVKAKKNKGEPLNDMATVSARSITVEETQRFAGSFSDPSRMVSSYAGVVGSPDGDNSIIIRGNSPKGLLWRVEGIDVPNPNHFANEGSTGGPISILNSTTLGSSDFFTSAFPAGYGDAFSGVFDIKLRNGNNQKHEYTAQVGVIGMELAAEGPFSKDNSASYLVNYRYSSLDLLNQVGVKVAGDAVPKFQDLTFNINVPTKRFGTFKLFGIGGYSTITFSDEEINEDFNITMGVVGLNNILPLSDKTYLKSSLSASTSKGNWEYSELDTEVQQLITRGTEDLDYVNFRGAIELSHKFSAKNSFKGGVSVFSKQFDLLMDNYDYDEKLLVNVLNDDGRTELTQGFLAWKFRPIQSLTFNSGVNFTYLVLNGSQSIEPRLGMRWQLAPGHAITAGYGWHSKMESVSLYLFKIYDDNRDYTQPNKDLDFIRAQHYVLGYDWRLSKDFNLKVEAYYQNLYNVPVENDPESYFSMLNEEHGYVFTELVNQGEGRNYGTEITFEKFFSKDYYFLFTTSLYESKFTAMDGIERDSRYNGNYVMNLVGGKEFPMGKKRNNALGLNVKATFAGGQHYSPIDRQQSIEAGHGVRPPETAFSAKRPDYFRTDLKVSFRRNKGKTTRVWELDIQNVSNTLNVVGDWWNNDDQKVETWTQMGILPVVNYRIEF